MPLTFGIPLGLLIALIGATIYFFTKRKKAAGAVIVAGLGIAILTTLLVILALRSSM